MTLFIKKIKESKIPGWSFCQLLQRSEVRKHSVGEHRLACMAQDRKAWHWVIAAAQNITGTHLLSRGDICEMSSPCKARRLLMDQIHFSHNLFNLPLH